MQVHAGERSEDAVSASQSLPIAAGPGRNRRRGCANPAPAAEQLVDAVKAERRRRIRSAEQAVLGNRMRVYPGRILISREQSSRHCAVALPASASHASTCCACWLTQASACLRMSCSVFSPLYT